MRLKIIFTGVLLLTVFFLTPNYAAAASCRCVGTYDDTHGVLSGGSTGGPRQMDVCVSNFQGVPIVNEDGCDRWAQSAVGSRQRDKITCTFYSDDECKDKVVKSIACGQDNSATCFQSEVGCNDISSCPVSFGNSVCMYNRCYFDELGKQSYDKGHSDVLFGLIKTDLEITAPDLRIRIPGLNFSEVENTLDEDGYLHIPYLPEYIAAVYKFGLAIASLLAISIIIKKGFDIAISPGGEAKAEAFKRIGEITAAVLLIWGSYFILYYLNPQLVQFKVLRVKYVEQILPPEPKSDEADSSFDGVPAPSCDDPKLIINDLNTFDPSLSKEYKNVIDLLSDDQVALYKTAVAAVPQLNVPWEILAVVHYKEAGMKRNKSVLNGGALCNTANDGDLLTWCGECSVKTLENDLICGARKIRQKAGSGNLDPSNIELVKSVFCKYNGCFTCPDAHPYVSALFDKNHTNISKQIHDCVPAKCKPDAKSDFTIKPPQRNKGCTITVFSDEDHPQIGLNNYCLLNQTPLCGVTDGNKTTYTYNNNTKTTANACGSWVIQQRAGALGIYSAILKKFGFKRS